MLSFHYTGYSTIKDIAKRTVENGSINEKHVCVTSLKLLADFWTLRIIVALSSGKKRFCELQRAVDNVNPVTLSKRLQKLEEAKLIHRQALDDGISVMYELTEKGTFALPVIDALNAFATAVKNK